MNTKINDECKKFEKDIDKLCKRYKDICIIVSYPSNKPNKDGRTEPRIVIRRAQTYGVVIQTLHSIMIEDPKLVTGLMVFAEMHKDALVKAGLMKPESNKTGYIR